MKVREDILSFSAVQRSQVLLEVCSQVQLGKWTACGAIEDGAGL